MIIHQILHDQRSVPCFLIISVQSRKLKDRDKAETCTDYTISDTEEFFIYLMNEKYTCSYSYAKVK